VAETADVTVLVDTAKVAVVLPGATVTDAGTLAAPLLLESETDAPPAGAARLRVTVPVAEVPPMTLEGLTEIAETVAEGVIVSAVLVVVPL